MNSRRIRWNRVVLLLAVAGIPLVICIGIWAFAPVLRQMLYARYWKTDQALAAQAAHRMIDYELPPDYQELRVLTVGDMDAAVIIAHRERPGDFIYLGGLTDGIIDVEEWRTRYEENLSKEMGDRRYDARALGTQMTTIRGQPVTVRLFDGTDQNGEKVRQVVCSFTGKSGDLLLGIVGSQDTWDQAMVDRFLRSIR